jgi:hypothetical protein
LVSYGLGNEIGLFLWLVAGGAGLSGLLAANPVHTPCSQWSEPPIRVPRLARGEA